MLLRQTKIETTVQIMSETNDEESEISFPRLPVADIDIIFQELGTTAVNCHVDGAIIYLRRACRAFLESKQNESAPERQLLITEIMEK